MPRDRRYAPLFLLASFALVAALAAACGDDDSSDTDTSTGDDTGTDSDTDSDTDTNPDACAGCTDSSCISSITGTVLYDDGTPMVGTVAVCIPQCVPLETDASGRFVFGMPNGCLGFDFETGDPIHVTLYSTDNTHTQFSVALAPTQAEISDQGADDYVVDVGTYYQYALPATGAAYTEADGASVSQDGVAFELEPGALSAMETPLPDATVKVLRFPLDEWVPPFDTVGLDALYFLSPYWAEIDGGGAQLTIDLPSGWAAGDTGTVYNLGDFANGVFLSCGGEDQPQGELAECGTAAVEAGKVVTTPINRLGWVGLKKD
jgi:hypothetical protein